MTEKTSIIKCTNIGIAMTTPVHVLEKDGVFEARAGCAIMGTTNMTEEQMNAQGRNPFLDDWHDNFVRGKGDTREAAINAMRNDASSMAESLWI